MLDEREIGKIVLDVEQSFHFAIESSKWRRRGSARFQLIADTFHERKLNPKARSHGWPTFADSSTHRFGQTFGKGQPKASALRFAVLGPEPIKRREETAAFVWRDAGTFIDNGNA